MMNIIYIATDCFNDVTGNRVFFSEKFTLTNDYGDFLELTSMKDSNRKVYVNKLDMVTYFGVMSEEDYVPE